METMTLAKRAKLFAALSDPTRLRIVELLADGGELTGSAVSEKVGISTALVCYHWRILEEAGAITRRKAGQNAYCSLNRRYVHAGLAGLLQPSGARAATVVVDEVPQRPRPARAAQGSIRTPRQNAT